MTTRSDHNNKRNRAESDILADILSVSLKGAKKTHIMYKANLSYEQVKTYLAVLLKSDLVSFNEKTYEYTTSESGLDYLEKYTSVKF